MGKKDKIYFYSFVIQNVSETGLSFHLILDKSWRFYQ